MEPDACPHEHVQELVVDHEVSDQEKVSALVRPSWASQNHGPGPQTCSASTEAPPRVFAGRSER